MCACALANDPFLCFLQVVGQLVWEYSTPGDCKDSIERSKSRRGGDDAAIDAVFFHETRFEFAAMVSATCSHCVYNFKLVMISFVFCVVTGLRHSLRSSLSSETRRRCVKQTQTATRMRYSLRLTWRSRAQDTRLRTRGSQRRKSVWRTRWGILWTCGRGWMRSSRT